MKNSASRKAGGGRGRTGTKRRLFAAGFCAMLACLGLYVAQPGLIKELDLLTYDAMLTNSPAGTPSPRPAIVDIDEASLRALGQWPWPRYKLAQLIAGVYQGGASAVGLDILLSEPDRSSPLRLKEELKQNFGIDLPLDALPAQLHDNDALLAQILKASPTVTGMFLQSGAAGTMKTAREEEAASASAKPGANATHASPGTAGATPSSSGATPAASSSATSPAPSPSASSPNATPATSASATPDPASAHGGAGQSAASGATSASSATPASSASPTSSSAPSPAQPSCLVMPPPCGTADVSPKGMPSPRVRLTKWDDAILPLPGFCGSPSGFINAVPDADGIIRNAVLLAELDGKIYASLALRTLMAAEGRKTVMLRSGPDGLQELQLGRTRIPLSPEGTMRVKFRGGHGVYPVYSALDVMQGRLPKDALKGSIVFIGASAAGLMDLRATPFGAGIPGVDTHAAIVDSILEQDFVRVPPWTVGAQVVLIVAFGLLSGLAFGLASPKAYLMTGALLLGGVIGGSWYSFLEGWFFSPVYGVITVVAEMFSVLVPRVILMERQKRELRRAFGHYVSPEIVRRIDEKGEGVLAGEQRECTVFFSDIRGFTSLSETLRPDQVVGLLNRYFTPMTACIRQSGGTLDKFIGDAIMAFWNAPVDVEDHPRRAVLTTLEMRKRLDELNVDLQERFGVTLRNGAGLHTGLVYVGNMGSEELMDYTCIGDNVNLASRLEGMTGQYGVAIVISGETAARCEGIDLQKLDVIRVKGRHAPVEIFTAFTPEEAAARAAEMARFDTARAAYAEGRFAEALPQFEALAAEFPEGRKTYDIFTARCRSMAAEPPADWDGVWTFYSK